MPERFIGVSIRANHESFIVTRRAGPQHFVGFPLHQLGQGAYNMRVVHQSEIDPADCFGLERHFPVKAG